MNKFDIEEQLIKNAAYIHDRKPEPMQPEPIVRWQRTKEGVKQYIIGYTLPVKDE